MTIGSSIDVRLIGDWIFTIDPAASLPFYYVRSAERRNDFRKKKMRNYLVGDYKSTAII